MNKVILVMLYNRRGKNHEIYIQIIQNLFKVEFDVKEVKILARLKKSFFINIETYVFLGQLFYHEIKRKYIRVNEVAHRIIQDVR